MAYSKYLGHESQLSGVEEHRLVGGKGDGMRLFEVRNGLGLSCVVSADRCADLSRLTFRGWNMGYFSPCGYVGPAYYDKEESNWLKSFTAGFLTTCGLTAVGSPCEDDGERLPLHGTIANTPAEHIWWRREAGALVVEAEIRDAVIFGRKLLLHRKWTFSTEENTMKLQDTVENVGDTTSPLMLLYHMNMGYPLLSENAQVVIPSSQVTPRDAHAAQGLQERLAMQPPTAGYVEQCFYHQFEKQGEAKIFNPDIGVGLAIRFDPSQLNAFCQWKMMGEHDYVLGLEPGNCTPDGRDVLRREGRLQFLAPGEVRTFAVEVQFYDDYRCWSGQSR